MLSPATHAARRAAVRARVRRPVLLVGVGAQPRNIPMNHLPFRQCSHLLYLSGCAEPGAALLLGPDGDTLFLTPPADDDALWHGKVTPIEERGRALGFDRVRPLDELDAAVAGLGPLASVPNGDPVATARAAALSGVSLTFGRVHGDEELVDALIELRRRLGPEEVAEVRGAAVVTALAHRAAMGVTAVGRHEREVGAIFDGVIAANGLVPAYTSIVTVRGEVLHEHARANPLKAGQLLLLDGGAEAPSGYATDVTRVWPVSGTWTGRQRAAVDAVIAAQEASIGMCRPGVRYRDVHLTSARVLARWLCDEGLLRGDPDDAVAAGAHALFFPHGVGHLLGLDVHDLEAFGDRPAYPPGRARSPQFGLGYLRLDRDLEAGNLVTVEPGFYVVPAILADPRITGPLAPFIDLDRARAWEGFGGVRIEDDVLVTPDGPEVLTAAIPKRPDEVAACVGVGPHRLW
jgi:Xaa-Pro aminopeptidase